MSTLQTKHPTIETVGERKLDSSGVPVMGTITVGLGTMAERLERDAVDQHLARSAGPDIPVSLKRTNRSWWDAVAAFVKDDSSLPAAGADQVASGRKEMYKIAFGLVALLALIIFFSWQRGLLQPWIKMFWA